jgi:hypothetical protein
MQVKVNRRAFFASIAAAVTGWRIPTLSANPSIPLAGVTARFWNAYPMKFHPVAFSMKWPKIGSTITVRRPERFCK